MAGWFKIWRNIENSISWSRGLEYRGLMLTLLHKANWKKRPFDGHVIEPGQLATSQSKLANELRIDRKKISRMLQKLTCDGFIQCQNIGNRFTIITIVNWDGYQGKQDGERPTNDQPMTTIEEGKKERKEKSLSSSGNQNDGSAPSRKTSAPPVPYNAIVELYHEVLPELPQVKILSQKRKTAIKKRWFHSRESQELEYWQRFFEYVRKSPFLMGEKTDFMANIDFLFTESTFIKIIEGTYHGQLPNQN